MSTYHIHLEDGQQLFDRQIDETEDPGWWADDNVIHQRTEHGQHRWKLPKGAARVAMMRLGKSRAQLTIGGFTTTTVAVTGPRRAIERLREAVL